MYNKTILENGIRVLSEEIPHVRSVSIGIWANVGARNEKKDINGISHFIEHMLFKGTERRTAEDIAREMDSVGGILNAFTNREYTCFYAKVLEKHLPMAVDLLSDIFLNSVFDPEEIEKERKVILQEICMVEDTPDDFVHDLFNISSWPDDPLGRPILGTVDTIRSVSGEQMKRYMSDTYLPRNIIISASGALKHEKFISILDQKGFRSIQDRKGQKDITNPIFKSDIIIQHKKLEQVHLCLGTKSIGQTHPMKYHNYVLNTVLGGGMSSRLFQEIREKRGLAYSVYSYSNSYTDAGSFVIYAGTGVETCLEVIGLVKDELMKVKNELINERELSSAKEQIKGNLVLGLESTDSWMTKLARNEIYFGRDITVDEIMNEVDAVTAEGVRELADQLFRNDVLGLTVIGDLTRDRLPDDILRIN